MTRQDTLDAMTRAFARGDFFTELKQRVSVPTESQIETGISAQHQYLQEQMIPLLTELGFTSQVYQNPSASAERPTEWPLLIAQRIENPESLTVLMYGHGDVVRGDDSNWKEGLSPWDLTEKDGRWYGRGAADNKGQHSVNLAALRQVLHSRGGTLGFNVKLILEMAEEAGSPGLSDFCASHKEELKADLFIASDGPRVAADNPTLFLGSRGSINFELTAKCREGAHHSGNWGGLLRNAATRLTHAWASLIDAKGRVLVPGLLPEQIPPAVREAIRHIRVGQDKNAPAIDPNWGEPDLTPAERVFGWNTLELLACTAGNPQSPGNAIPGTAKLVGQIRYVVGSDHENFLNHIREHLAAQGFDEIEVTPSCHHPMQATRLDPSDPWVNWALSSIQNSTSKKPVLLPNLGGSIPNDVFAYTLGLPTLWIPHSYPACSQHAPNEHVLPEVMLEGLLMMTGLFWDLAEEGNTVFAERNHLLAQKV